MAIPQDGCPGGAAVENPSQALDPCHSCLKYYRAKAGERQQHLGSPCWFFFCRFPPAHSKRQQGCTVLPPKGASRCFVNLVAVRVTDICSGGGGDLLVIHFETLKGGEIWLSSPTSRSGRQALPALQLLPGGSAVLGGCCWKPTWRELCGRLL